MNIFNDILKNALYATSCDKSHAGEKYRPGDGVLHVERIRPRFYGLYEKTLDNPEGNNWTAWIVKIECDTIKIIDIQSKSDDFYHERYFSERLGELPLKIIEG